MNPVRLSIVLPYRDAAATLPACLDSIAAQTLEDYELIAVDDGSRDASATIVKRRAADDARVRPLVNPGRGLVDALNAGLAASRAPIVARMDADDVMYPMRLARQLAVMSAAPDIAVLGCQVRLTSDTPLLSGLREYGHWQNACLTAADVRDEIYIESPFAHPSVCLRKEAIVAAGGYRDGAFPEDYDLWLRLAQRGLRMEKIPEVLLDWHDSPTRLTRTDPRYARDAFDRLRATYLAADPRLLSAATRLVIWGAGRRTRQRCRHLLDKGFTPRAWIDIDPKKIGNRLAGVPVVGAEALAAMERPFVLAYVTNHGARAKIGRALVALGLRRGRDYLFVG